MKPEIKPCPFCGFEHEYGEDPFEAHPGGWSVTCYNIACCASGPVRETKEKAFLAWNVAVQSRKGLK